MAPAPHELSPWSNGSIARARYNAGMQHDAFELRGSYRYPSLVELDRALIAARARIEDDELADLEPDWMQAFVRRGTTLRVQVLLPAAADRFLAAEVIQTLARSAVEGVIEINRDGRCVDWFPSQQLE
jgi:PAS domain-containing protein